MGAATGAPLFRRSRLLSARRRRVAPGPALAGLVAVTVAAAVPRSAAGQSVLGRLLDERTEAPVAGALVRLLDADGDEQVRTLTDSIGRFHVRPPRAGEFVLTAARIGYENATTPLLALRTEGSAGLELLMRPLPVGLEGLEVTVSATERMRSTLDLYGVALDDIPATRLVSRREIERRSASRDLGQVLEWQAVPGMTVTRQENMGSGGPPFLCISLSRARTGAGGDACALIVVDGVASSPELLVSLTPDQVESIVILHAREAATAFGTPGGGGAVLVFTRGALRPR